MGFGKKVTGGILLYLGIMSLPLGITNLVMAHRHDECDNKDIMYVSDYLTGLGISTIIISVISIVCGILSLCGCGKKTVLGFYSCILGCNILFATAWFIIGAVILFRSNIDCINQGSVHVIYALVLWCITAAQCV